MSLQKQRKGPIDTPGRKRLRLETYNESQTVTKLVELVGLGKLSVSGAVDLANCMVSDGADHEAICAFSSLGTNGKNPQNCERDLHRWLEGLGIRLQPYTVTMNLQVLLLQKKVSFATLVTSST